MDLFKSGQKINLYFPKDENLVSISCTISNVKNDRLYVELPQYFMRYIEYLEDGKKLTAKVFSKMGTIDFNTIVISSPLEDNFIIELDYNAIKFTPSEEIPSVNAIENLIIKSEETPILVKTFEISTEYIKFDSDKKFEIENSEKTKFMIVMNKANEGLHVKGVDGIIWFRALDENSRILYLQQLGRTITSIDPNNPVKDEDRPVVIDLANNTKRVDIDKEIKSNDGKKDLE